MPAIFSANKGLSCGAVVYNGFWNPKEPPDPVRRLTAAAERWGECLIPIPNTALTADLNTEAAVDGWTGEYAIFWDKDIRLARALEASGIPVYNRAAAIELCDDKAACQLALTGKGLPMPRTLVAPMTYRAPDEGIELFCRRAESQFSYPLVLKECYGSFGGQVYLVQDGDELRARCRSMGSRPFLAQEYLASSAGEDYRLYMVGGHCVAAMRRHSDTDFRANIGSGGVGEVYCPTETEREMAEVCCRLLGLSFGAVDFLHDRERGSLICEVNSNAFMAEITTCTGVDVAEKIWQHVWECQKSGKASD
ncbi:MAG: RimK family alpha-L-glutamate ligase [Clostridiales bacterium]|nr:RimK family alpha-L-glutamate ligase [Clostridiales bacterium]